MITPYFEDAGITLFNADWREVLPSLDVPGALIVADPPYGQTSLKWDQWQGEFLSAIPASIRSLWCFGSLRMFIEHISEFAAGDWKLSQDLVWEKHNGSSFHADRFRRVHESICHFYRGDWGTVPHECPTTPDATARTIRRKMRPAHMGHIDAGAYRSEDGGPRLQRSVIYHRSMHGNAINPTQKPVELVKPLIEYASKPGSLVISPFCGSGTDLVAAKEMGRPAIGMEIDEWQCERAAERLSQGLLDFSRTPITTSVESEAI
jgi:site-specific DNA-methyltransferase (adenine-specific)